LTCHSDIRIAAAAQAGFRPGFDDLIIVPLALTVLLAWVLYRAALFVVLLVSDLVFTLFLWVIALPFLVAAIAGDGAAWLLKHLVVVLRLSGEKRQGWRDRVDRHWSGLRHRISHEAIALTARSVLQRAVVWVFDSCGALSPRAALIVIAGVAAWLPLSAGISLAMHAVLLAKAASLPPWMQLLHPVATVIAKSKFVLLPAYPAAWPQAKKHAWVQAAFRRLDRIAALDCSRKAFHRYRQTKRVLGGSKW
jgi:hypothetical protein